MKLFNTLTKNVEEFVPNVEGKVNMYTCGPTVYHFAHIGNLRSYIMEDVLEKMFRYAGYDVKRVMNITDVGHLSSDADEGEDDEEQEEAVEDEDPATEPDPEEEPEPVESDESRRNRRLAAEFLKLAQARGYKSAEEMLADETGGSVKEIEDRVSSKEMTDEEKIAAYDKMMAEKKSAKLEKEGKAVHDRLLAQIHKEFPETVGTLKNLDKVPNAERFRELVLKKGLTGDEAYAICAAKVIRAVAAKAAKPSGKEHIRPDSRKASGNATAVSSSDMAQYRSMFPELSDAQIRAMYARTSKT